MVTMAEPKAGREYRRKGASPQPGMEFETIKDPTMRPFKHTFLGLVAMAGLLTMNLAAPGAQAQQIGPYCSARTDVLTQLKGNYAEKPRAMGLASNGFVVEVLSSEDGTWTIIITQPDGLTCLMATGKHWQPVIAKAKGIPL